jgi:hypothetical protein
MPGTTKAGDRRPHGAGDLRLRELAAPFAQVAAANITRAYPYAPQQLLTGPGDLAEPRTIHPAFYGAYDWHSSVHMHWLLVRLLRRAPDRIDAAAVCRILDAHLTPAHLAAETDRLRGDPTFERPYGWAWLVTLAAECAAAAQDGAPWAAPWTAALGPAAAAVCAMFEEWLARATYPVRHGVHGNSAFALGLLMDAAPVLRQDSTARAAAAAVGRWYLEDRDCPAGWEPSGQDFLSPALTEADAVRRILPREEFAGWLTGFLPGLAERRPRGLLEPPAVSDPRDPQIGHLLGLSLSRAAALRSLASALPPGDPRGPVLAGAADAHLAAGLPHATTGDFTSDHWLGTFAILALDSAGRATSV